MPTPPSIPGSRPVAPAARMASLDIMRGIALLGVLLMNIQSFGLILSAYENPFHSRELGPFDRLVWSFQHHFIEGRAISTFSILFGAGIILSTQRQDQAGIPSAAYFYRRYGMLAVVGLLHAYLIWFGDILFGYALCGFIVYLMRKLKARTLLIVGGISLLTSSLLMALYMYLSTAVPWLAEEMHSYWWPSESEIRAEVEAVRGSWRAWSAHNVSVAWWHHLSIPFGLIQFTGGLMLIGMGLQKSGFFAGKWPRKHYTIVLVVGLLLGAVLTIPASAYDAAGGQIGFPAWRYALAEWDGPLMSLGYLSGIMIFLSMREPGWILQAFGRAGRMALTLYLSQSVLCGFLFNGYGLGLFERLGHASLAALALVIFALQLIFARLWFQRFEQGPLEALWRRASYR